MDVENRENDQNVLNELQDEVFRESDQKVVSDKNVDEDKTIQNDTEDDLTREKLRNIVDSDSEEDNTNEIIFKRKAKKRLTLVDSDSEDEPTPHNKSFAENLQEEATVYIADKNGEIIPENTDDDYSKRLSKLCDSESSAEETDHIRDEEVLAVVPKSKGRKLKEKTEKPKRMTTKEALQQRQEIMSESQRRTREMNVSLPYHRPKMRTLKEFLERRPKFASAVPDKTVRVSPAVALKMTKQQLEIISKNLSEREKKVEEYFKSESESEEENKEVDLDKADPVEEINPTETNIKDVDHQEDNTLKENINLEDISNNIHKGGDEVISESPQSVVILSNVLLQEPDENKIAETNLEQSEGFNVEVEQIISEQEQVEKLIEKYGNESEKENDTVISEKKKNVTDILKEKLGDFQPKLRKTDFINLDENVDKLMQRFIKHTAKKQPHKHNVHLDIINVANGEVHKEKLEMEVEDDAIPILEKPGERLKKLKDELEGKINEQRSKFWQEKINNKQENNHDEFRSFKDMESEDEDLLDKVTEDEFTEIEDDEDGDEIANEDDEDDKEPETKKSAFIENEAEESDRDDEEENCVEMGNDENEDEEDVEEVGEMNVDYTENEENIEADDEDEQTSTTQKKKKKLRRIIQVFENDSDEDDNEVNEKEKFEVKNSLLLDTTDTLDDLSGPTPHQKRNDHTPIKPNVTQTKSELGFLTPVIQLTGLQSLNSGSKFLHDSPVSPFVMPKQSPCRSSQSGPQKKLFCDDVSESQILEDIADVCSGKFATQTQKLENECKNSKLENNQKSDNSTYEEAISTTQDFLEICSGKFTGITQVNSTVNNNLETKELQQLNVGDNKEKEIENSSSKSTNYTAIMTSNDEIKDFNDKDDERLISQLLDEDEMERFKKKFASPEKQVGRKIFDSDDETEISLHKKKVKNCISDEEDELNIPETMDSDNCDEEEPKEIEYDSEENEIEVSHQKKLKASDFFEEEAELSESEWGSADEDEKDLDTLEFEEGDAEKLDERKVKRDLERIHMRRILDEDNREVKMLQEILLDDGELNGTGRERQFKWRNINTTDNNDGDSHKADDGEVYLDDENENEEQWRKMRFEREIFLRKQQSVSEQYDETIIETESTSQIFKLGQAAIKRSLSNTPNNTISKSDSPDFKTSFTLVNKKGSFLSRSEQVLAKVAEITSKTINPTIGGAKNSRNFVFHTVQSTTEVEKFEMKNIKKRKANDGTPAAIKKLRLNSLSPAVKNAEKSERVKKLFSNW